jgi:hypothetical protein
MLEHHFGDTDDVDCRGGVDNKTVSCKLSSENPQSQKTHVYQLMTAAIKIRRARGQLCTPLSLEFAVARLVHVP